MAKKPTQKPRTPRAKSKQPAAKARSDLFASMMEGLTEFQAYLAGDRAAVAAVHHVHVPSAESIKAMRTQYGMTQKRFAESFGLPIDSLQNWEAGRRAPDTSAQVLLQVIAHNPQAVIEALHAPR